MAVLLAVFILAGVIIFLYLRRRRILPRNILPRRRTAEETEDMELNSGTNTRQITQRSTQPIEGARQARIRQK